MKHVLFLLLITAVPALLPAATNDSLRPNVVVVLMDDHRWDDLGCTGHPFVKTPHIDRIAREGARFASAFVTTPLCSPSRAGFLTGQYAQRTGITDNIARNQRSHELRTFPRMLHGAGYATGFVGKWHMGTDDSPRPGFDYWVSVQGQGDYFDPRLNINGQTTAAHGYVTDIFTDHAIAFLKQNHGKPFCLWLAHKAVHPDARQNADGSVDQNSVAKNFFPAERHKRLYAGLTPPRRPNFGAPKNKPALERAVGNLPPLSRETGTDDETILNRLRMLAAVDEGLGRLLRQLEESGQLDRTFFVFTSDEGYFYGEHGLSVERRLAYEESIRIPLLIRYPALIKAGTVVDAMVLNLDLAPTILELAGVRVPADVHGRSLLPLLSGRESALHDNFLIEYFSDTVFPRVHRMGYKAVRSDRWKYIHYLEIQDADELYDLQRDPYELHNLVREPRAAVGLDRMRAELAKLQASIR